MNDVALGDKSVLLGISMFYICRTRCITSSTAEASFRVYKCTLDTFTTCYVPLLSIWFIT